MSGVITARHYPSRHPPKTDFFNTIRPKRTSNYYCLIDRLRVEIGPLDGNNSASQLRRKQSDIDDQRRAAEELKESERRLREINQKHQERAERRVRELGASRAQMQAIFDNSPDWLTLFHANADGRFVYADRNHATERAYELSYD